jgi:hypothetical protein
MRPIKCHRSVSAVIALMLVGVLSWPTATTAQLGGLLPPTSTTPSTVTGDASAVQATVLGTTTVLSDTGVISATNTEQDVSQDTGSVTSLLTAEVLSSSTYSYVDEVDSQSSLGDLNMAIGAISITADSVVAEASQVLAAPGSGASFVDNLAINGVPVAVTGEPNQTVAIPGGQMVINEQTISSTGTAVVNAIHVTVTGVADVVIASATAGIS